MKPRVLILRTAGTNCDGETAHAFELAGGQSEFLHVNRLLESPRLLDGYQVLALPGGFSYGDDIAAGRILAAQIMHHLRDAMNRFVDSGKPIIGICNGFQVLVKTELLPGPLAGRSGQTATLTNNDCGRFVDRWVHLNAPPSACIWTAGLDRLELPVAHGEGKFVCIDEQARQALWANRQVALVYAPAEGQSVADNPNGSQDDIAGVCDASGLVFGLMPHPERYVSRLQHPAWTRQSHAAEEGAGLRCFRNALKHVNQAVGAGI